MEHIKFVEIWEKVCSNEQKNLLLKWNDAKIFTSKILYDSDSIVKSIAIELNLCVYSECRAGYYGIDAVFYYPDFRVADTGYETWLTKIQIAFEHKNYFDSNLFTEISRLLTSNSELRVLITYPKDSENFKIFLNDFKYLF